MSCVLTEGFGNSHYIGGGTIYLDALLSRCLTLTLLILRLSAINLILAALIRHLSQMEVTVLSKFWCYVISLEYPVL